MIIFLSTCLISGSAAFSSLFFLHFKKIYPFKRKEKVAFVARKKSSDQLSFSQLCKVMGLFSDHKNFDLDLGERHLESFPLISQARLSVIADKTLYADYQLRDIFAYFHDLEGAAFDEQGVVFPANAFISPKNVPKIYFGLKKKQSLYWGLRLSKECLSFAKRLVNETEKQGLKLVFIDLSRVSSKSIGKRQIVLIIEDSYGRKILRLAPKKFEDALRRYHLLKEQVQEHAIVDLRLDHLAFIQNWSSFFVLDN